MLLPVDGNDNINDQKYIVARDKKMSHRYLSACFLAVKFGLSEKHKKFEKIFLMVLTNQLIYLVNVKP